MADDQKLRCPTCDSLLDEGAIHGLCAKCLLAVGMRDPGNETDADLNEATIVLGAGSGTGPDRMPPQGAPPMRVVDDYELVEELARGGMGVVYKAVQRSLNRTVALKMILAGSLASPADRQRFQTEAEAAAQLDHPGIVPIYEVGLYTNPQGDQPYYSMAFIEGASLEDLIHDEPMEERKAAEMVLEIASAVAYAHSQGIIHRDLKPANILLDAEGRPRITDFGLAKQADSDSQLTATGQMMGTPSFMPPEQVAGRIDQMGPAADIYALGAILYCLLTGKPPFVGETILETLNQVLEREPVSPTEFCSGLDVNLETICLKCLEKKPEARFASVEALIEELNRFLAGEPIQSRRISAWERIARWRQMVKRNPNVRIQSKTRVLGIPLVAIALGEDRSRGESMGTARGIVAIGDRAYGILAYGNRATGVVAYGLHARGGITLGLTSIGLISSGFLTLGGIALGGIAFGYLAIGCVAVGYTSVGLVTVGKLALGAFRWKIGG